MNLLMLGPVRLKFLRYLDSFGDQVRTWEDTLAGNDHLLAYIDFIVSYGYRYLIGREIVDRFHGKIVNLHISLLPWNRGADPNLWSFLDDTPKGVSIHYVDYGIDTGPILAQREVPYREGDTLKTSYLRLSNSIEQLFIEVWPAIRKGRIEAIPQIGPGTCHRLRDRQRYEHLLTHGWDTPVSNLIGRAHADGLEGRA